MDDHAHAVAAGVGGLAKARVRQHEEPVVLVPVPDRRAMGAGISLRNHGLVCEVRTR